MQLLVSIPLYPYTQEISVNYVYTRGSSNLQTFRGYNNEMFEVPFMYPIFILWIQSTNVLISPHILSWPCNMNLKITINLIDLKYWPLVFFFAPFCLILHREDDYFRDEKSISYEILNFMLIFMLILWYIIIDLRLTVNYLYSQSLHTCSIHNDTFESPHSSKIL